jgi:uncharacterized repeat protein (TIGR01451 family)
VPVQARRLPLRLVTCLSALLLFSAATAEAQITPIHDVQGPGASSPIVGNVITTRGIVTGVKADGFFIQAPDADVDADPATSEGIFVFTSSAPPAAAAFSASVEVTGMVQEFVPLSDPLQPPSTRLISPAVTQLAAPGQALPSAIPLSATFPDPAGPYDQLERVEHMRVSVASLTVSGPSGGTVDESAATGTSNGRFFGVITGVARPFREPGIPSPDPTPSGSIPPIPRWDSNPERIGVDSAAIVGQPVITVWSHDRVTSLVGPLDFVVRTYVIALDGTSTPTIVPGSLPTTVSVPAGNDVTVASIHLRRFFDTVDDPTVADVVLTPTAYDRRLAKTSIAIRTHLRNPDIIGVQEVETVDVLNDLAARIVADGGPQYQPFLVPGTDPAGLNVGLLYKTALIGGFARVSNLVSVQIGAIETWLDPATGAPALLNDRPPLLFMGTVNRTGTSLFPIVVIVADLQGLEGIDSFAAAGLTTVGDRVRRKRQAQAEFLANYVQARQTLFPGEHLVVIGGFNAFDVNDGQVDVMHVIAGTPPPDNQTSVPGDGVDLMNPDLTNLVNTPPAAERYSDVFNGTARNLDHVLINQTFGVSTSSQRIERPRIAADYSEDQIGNGALAFRFSDRDPVVAYFRTSALSLADISITKVVTSSPVIVGQNLTYSITLTNNGPDASSAGLSDPLPATTTFVSLSAPAGWSCSTPAVGAGGTVNCSIASMSVGSAVFTLVVRLALSAGPVVINTASAGSDAEDPALENNVASVATAVIGPTDVSISKTATPFVAPGGSIAYAITVINAGPPSASSVVLSDTLPAGTTFVSLNGPPGWSCSTPAVGAGGTVTCSIASMSAGAAGFYLVVAVAPTIAFGTPISNLADVSTVTADTVASNNSATAATTVTAISDVSITKTGPATVVPGASIAYTLTVTNHGPIEANRVMVSDPAPAGLTLVSATGACVTLPCNVDALPAGASRTITATFRVPPDYRGANPIVNTATVSSDRIDPVSSNDSASASTMVISTNSGCDALGDGRTAFITGAGLGGGPHVRVWSTEISGRVTELFGQGFFAYDPAFPGGVRVACKDLTGDGIAEIITGAGPGGGPHVRIWSIRGGTLSEITGFFAYHPAFPGGVAVAAGDLNGDGVAELITGAGPGGGPHVRVWNLVGTTLTELTGFFAYHPAFPGGVAIAAGDLNGDGVAELITGAGPGGGPHVRVWNVVGTTLTELTGFFAFDPAFPGGVTVASGDLNGDGVAELVTAAGPGGAPRVRAWSLNGTVATEIAAFSPYPQGFAGGVSVAVGDVTGDGIAELITGAGPGGGPHVRVWRLTGTGFVELTGFFAYDPAFPGGVSVGR